MKKIFLLIVFFYLYTIVSLFSRVENYKDFNFLDYELFRNNKSIGYHKYNFEREGDFLKIKSIVDFKITKVGVDLYKYFAESEENYKNNAFHSKFYIHYLICNFQN